MWSDLSRPWQQCFELAWEAYCEDCIPIGAVVTDADGNILSNGRNRIFTKMPLYDHPAGNELAHAEVEALQGFRYGSVDQHTCTLYTSTEPCPMCMGTFYMSGLRTLHYASRDPYAGSANMLGTTWYLSRKPIKVSGPHPALEPVMTALFVEQELNFHGGNLPDSIFWKMYQKALPGGYAMGQSMYDQGSLRTMRKSKTDASEVYNQLVHTGV